MLGCCREREMGSGGTKRLALFEVTAEWRSGAVGSGYEMGRGKRRKL